MQFVTIEEACDGPWENQTPLESPAQRKDLLPSEVILLGDIFKNCICSSSQVLAQNY
jgi:hypothetical protein